MKPAELDAQISAAKRAGGRPFFVSCTVGTTVLGAFDPVNAIADVCEKHGLWLHADVSILLGYKDYFSLTCCDCHCKVRCFLRKF